MMFPALTSERSSPAIAADIDFFFPSRVAKKYIDAKTCCVKYQALIPKVCVWCAWRASQFDLQLTSSVNFKFRGLSASQPITTTRAIGYLRGTSRSKSMQLEKQHLDPDPIGYSDAVT